MNIGIVGSGAVALASAAWLAHGGHKVNVWSPTGHNADALRDEPLSASGVLTTQVRVGVVDNAAALTEAADVLLIAVIVNAHRRVMDALLPHLRDGQTIIISSMSSLSALYLAEQARQLGHDITVASWGTTVLTARRQSDTHVKIMTCRVALGVSAIPCRRTEAVVSLCNTLFGERFTAQDNALASALTNINPVAHGPLALYNWTRIERAEHWPQYHYMTSMVSGAIKKLDAERIALADAFGTRVRTIEQHFAQSFSTSAENLSGIADELHATRGGPPGPTDVATRFLAEDVPFGLIFNVALGRIAGVDMTATQAVIGNAALITDRDFTAENDLLEPLMLAGETVTGLLARVNH
ncbi:NAD/NADP octopine/nopaline dehydrogenase family protein [Ottowia thiooxydans]|uniref:NAD/NADP octopine/nopaline dehydrogenase family protein n=1 Tax=Ottowia thiooxydans TaxID=219182 RepID=UPI000417A26D|nr:NAD/NADP octopine/nopaline dehydrogenase family protein [Ottowia thiooxydans]